MKLERAQEVYSDYKEGNLSPAMKLALDQHFDTEPGARKDYDEFSQLFELISAATPDEVEAPHGFRAAIMARLSEDANKQTFNAGFLGTLRGFFAEGRRREATAILAAALIVALAITMHPGTNQVRPAPMFVIPTAPDIQTVVQGVETTFGDNVVYHNLKVHLPPDIPTAQVDVYAIKTMDEIGDPNARDRDATVVLKDQTLTNDESMVIPIGLQHPAPKGSTLNLLVMYTTPGASAPEAQVVFTPFNPDEGITPSTAPPADGNFFESLQTIAAAYHATIIVDASTAPASAIEPWSPGSDIDTALGTVADSAGYSIKVIGSGTDITYLLYHKPGTSAQTAP